MMSPFATAVVVKSDRLVDRMCVPLDSDTPLVLIELLANVGDAVPAAALRNFTVAVPESVPPIEISHATIVQAAGAVAGKDGEPPATRAPPPFRNAPPKTNF